MRWPIRNQLMFPLLGVAIASLVAVGAIGGLLSERRTCNHVEQQLQQVVGVLATSNFPMTDAVLRQMRDLSSAEFVLSDLAGATIASTLPNAGAMPDQPAVARLKDVSLGPSALVSGRWYFHTPVQLPLSAESGRAGVLHVLFPQDEYRRAWRQAFIPPLVVGLATLVAVGAVATTVAGRMGRSTARLSDEVLRIARGNFRPVELPALDDEIRDLSAAVNRTAEMLAEYEKQVRHSEQMRTLTILGASIAHQLRNAATGCRMALDLHASECRAPDSRECLDVARGQLRLMESQLQRFLRVGKQPAETVKRDVDLRHVIEELLPLVRPAAQHAGVTLDCQIAPDQVSVSGDEEALSQVVLNLLLNAVQAAQQNGIQRQEPQRVCVEVGATPGNEAEIVISDSGDGPAGSVADSLFEPFVTDKAEGAGLGLAVAKEVVAAHGGTIGWNRENGMTRFRVGLPLTKNGCNRV
jgi:signal transduction histidine kinase